ncbi:MAG: addiction module protein [Deltaproteobacteria bacterium]|jgi:putative addiction module component (TIGR02574 family)|nr:addiction module protein [Deltaproteobacteria bacterium]
MAEPKVVINEGLQLKPAEKVIVIEALIRSLDVPDPNIEKAWADEAERRLKAYKEGKLETISFEEMFE